MGSQRKFAEHNMANDMMTWQEHNSHGWWWESDNPKGYAVVAGASRFEFNGTDHKTVFALYERGVLICQQGQAEPLRQLARLRAGTPAEIAPNEPTPQDSIHHPPHYGGDTPYEAIKVIEAWGLGFCLGNALKYISRAGRKTPDAIPDLQKAIWYLNREIQIRERRSTPRG